MKKQKIHAQTPPLNTLRGRSWKLKIKSDYQKLKKKFIEERIVISLICSKVLKASNVVIKNTKTL